VAHLIAPTRGKTVPTKFLDGARPKVWLFDRLLAARTWAAPETRAVAVFRGLRALGKRLGRACEHVGDRGFGNLQAKQALQHLGQARVADHLAAVKNR
jgi:hypothetical protein